LTKDVHGAWQWAELRDGSLVFEQEDGLAKALRDGFFFVEQPSGLTVEAGDRFAESFYLPPDPGSQNPYRGYTGLTAEKIAPRQGYFRRDADQTEQFFLESRHWEAVFPPELAVQAVGMRDFALEILRGVFGNLDLPKRLWDKAAGGAFSLAGTYHLTFNHFRPEIEARGLNIHKDSGWVTVLRSLEPGLEVQRDGAWAAINPQAGRFIVNFGCAMEILTRNTATPVSAVAHRVRRQFRLKDASPDRYSYALFVDSSLDEKVCPGLYRYESGQGLVLESDFATFLDSIVHETYQPDGIGLY
jgi:isopenicillin N synthase-like dioxygenase